MALEVELAYDQVINCDPKFTALFAHDLTNSIPRGSVFFGGTDSGRSVATAFSSSHADGEPFFTLAQSALADRAYLDYLLGMYGDKLQFPSEEDAAKCFEGYVQDLRRRQGHDRELPQEAPLVRQGEEVQEVAGKVTQISPASMLAYSGLLARLVFEMNPQREFFVEEGLPMDWMYPYLEPHGTILRLNRQPLALMPPESLLRDHEFWHKLVADALGDGLDQNMPLQNLLDFVRRVHLVGDLTGFKGDPGFVRNLYAMRMFSKLRGSIAGIYAWRLQDNILSDYQPRTRTDREQLLRETENAFRQAYALWPHNPEVTWRYGDFLMRSKRLEDALLLTQCSLDLEPQNIELRVALDNLMSYRRQGERPGPPGPNVQSLDVPRFR